LLSERLMYNDFGGQELEPYFSVWLVSHLTLMQKC
jgi:hypothetical protein